MNEHVTSAAAGAAIASPFWLPSLQNISEIFGAFLPILGVIWLVVQIGAKVIEMRRKRNAAASTPS